MDCRKSAELQAMPVQIFRDYVILPITNGKSSCILELADQHEVRPATRGK